MSHTNMVGRAPSQERADDDPTFTSVRERHAATARVVANLVRSTLGPNGGQKMIVDAGGDVTLTGDGSTVLTEVEFDDPIAVLLSEVAQSQRRECGGGAAATVVLVSELLDEAEALASDGVQYASILQGFEEALRLIREEVADLARTPTDDDLLADVLGTRLYTGVIGSDYDVLASLLEEAVHRVSVSDSDADLCESIATVSRSGQWIGASEVVSGVLVEKSPVDESMPTDFEDATVLLVDGDIELDEPDDATATVHDPTGYQGFVTDDRRRRRELVDVLKNLDVDVVFCQQRISNPIASMLAEAGILATRFTVKPDIESLRRSLDVSSVPTLVEADESVLGRADVTFDEAEKTFHVVASDGDERVVTLLLRGSTDTVSSALERVVENALRGAEQFRRDGRILPGGGGVEAELARRLERTASSTSGRQQLVVEAVADALLEIPRTLAKNAGLDPLDAIVAMRTAHYEGEPDAGIDSDTGAIRPMYERGTVVTAQTVERTLVSALELATFLVRIDDVLPSTPSDGDDEVNE